MRPKIRPKLALTFVVALFLTFQIALFTGTQTGRLLIAHYFLVLRLSHPGLSQRFEPLMYDVGLLPTRAEIEPGVSLLLDPRDYLPRIILLTGRWQPEVWQAISTGLSEGSVLFDVGAHIGYDSLKGSVKVGKTGRVISFEPNPPTITMLRENVAASNAGNVIVEPIACTETEQTLTLYDATPEGNSAAASLSRGNADQQKTGALRSYSVRGRPIDVVTKELQLQRVDVVKIDVEGAEYGVLRGAQETLRRFHPKIVMEVYPPDLAEFGTTPADLDHLLNDLGYDTKRQVDEFDWEWVAH